MTNKEENTKVIAGDSPIVVIQEGWTTGVLCALNEMRTSGQFCDMALMSSDGENLPCHIAVMVASSGYFKRLLLSLSQTFVNAQATFHLGVQSKYLHHILAFVYTGEMAVDQEDMDSVQQTALFLEISGLQQLSQNQSTTATDSSVQNQPSNSMDHDVPEDVMPDATAVAQSANSSETQSATSYVLEDVLEQVDLGAVGGQDQAAPMIETISVISEQIVASDGASNLQAAVLNLNAEDPDFPYRCEFTGCNRKFRRRDSLQVHERVHTGARPFKCEECGKAYKQRAHLREHLRKHTGERPYACKYCDRRFASYSFYSRHQSTHVGAERPGATGLKDGRPGFKCQFCDKVILGKSHHQAHENKHRGIFPHKCSMCEQTFESRHRAYEHETIQHRLHKVSQCPVCFKVFSNKGHLYEHIRKHTGERPFACSEPGCKAKYPRKKDLVSHVNKVHHGFQLRYQCDLCEKSYADSNKLRQHKNTHTGTTPYQCPVCQLSFATYSARYKHMAKHIQKLWMCELCSVTFSRADSLAIHMAKFHPQGQQHRYSCCLCNKGFRLKSQLRRHVRRMHDGKVQIAKLLHQDMTDTVDVEGNSGDEPLMLSSAEQQVVESCLNLSPSVSIDGLEQNGVQEDNASHETAIQPVAAITSQE